MWQLFGVYSWYWWEILQLQSAYKSTKHSNLMGIQENSYEWSWITGYLILYSPKHPRICQHQTKNKSSKFRWVAVAVALLSNVHVLSKTDQLLSIYHHILPILYKFWQDQRSPDAYTLRNQINTTVREKPILYLQQDGWRPRSKISTIHQSQIQIEHLSEKASDHHLP